MVEPHQTGRRDNLFLVAAIALPLIVVALFLLASAIPRWTIPPPGYDLVVSTQGGYNPAASQVMTAIRVRDGKIVAEVQPAAPNTYPSRPLLYRYDHATDSVVEIPYDTPTVLDEGEKLRVVPVASLANRHVLEGATSPDGYVFDLRYRRGSGVMGEVFGMGRFDSGAAIANRGRVVRLKIPEPYAYSVQPIGWLAPAQEGR